MSPNELSYVNHRDCSRVSGERPVNSGLPYPGSLRLTLLAHFNSSHVVRTRFRSNLMVIKDNEFSDIPTLEQISPGTNSTPPMPSCGTKGLATMRPPRGWSMPWRWTCSTASLARATSRKFKAPSRRVIRRGACGTLSRMRVRRRIRKS